MIKAGVIGHPIAHSKSPIIHGYWLKQLGINGQYQRYDIHPENLKADIDQLVTNKLAGFNVTLPHKQSIIPYCRTLSEEARAIGAVNTVTLSEFGELHGHNTDAFGFTQNLIEQHPNFDWADARVLLLGAGGAAKAVLYALSQKNVKDIRITNRTQQAAEDIGKIYSAHIFDWDHRQDALKGRNLIINTTPLGMKGQAELDIDLSAIAQYSFVYDIVYNPLLTPLLRQAEQKGFKIITGIGMLLHQARPGFQSWFGQYPEVTQDLKNLIL